MFNADESQYIELWGLGYGTWPALLIAGSHERKSQVGSDT